MSLKTITRIVPADLQEVQVQANVTADGLLTDVIKSLQYNYNKIQTTAPLNKPLNTACPTCAIANVSQGFLNVTYQGQTIRTVCPTCMGYLIYNASGQLTPPTNPFNAQLVVTRLLPADLQEVINGFNASTTLSAMITSMQGNFDEPPTTNCPKCTHTGWQAAHVLCQVCSGWQKTVIAFVLTNGVYTATPTGAAMPNPNPFITPVNVVPG